MAEYAIAQRFLHRR